jgi:hypothetical protein
MLFRGVPGVYNYGRFGPTSRLRPCQYCLPLGITRSASPTQFSKLNTRPTIASVYASVVPSRRTTARLEVRMDRYSFPVGLFHPLQHAGLSRRSTPFADPLHYAVDRGPTKKARDRNLTSGHLRPIYKCPVTAPYEAIFCSPLCFVPVRLASESALEWLAVVTGAAIFPGRSFQLRRWVPATSGLRTSRATSWDPRCKYGSDEGWIWRLMLSSNHWASPMPPSFSMDLVAACRQPRLSLGNSRCSSSTN